MSSHSVVIVEDDAVISRVYTSLISGMPGFTVVGSSRTASNGLRLIEVMTPDVVLLDVGLPGGSNGIDLLRAIRSRGLRVEVVAITAHSSTGLVREFMRLGVLDYLVKPFSEDRLRQAMTKLVKLEVRRGASLGQQEVDTLREVSAPAKPWIPNELSEDRLKLVRSVLREATKPLTAGDLADAIGASRITARRYLEFLVTLREVKVRFDTDGPGRPRKLYSVTDSLVGSRPDSP